MTLDECMEKHTHRQFLSILEYFKMDMNTPSRDNYYAMQIAAEVRRGYVEKSASVRLDQFLLQFETRKMGKLTKNQRVQLSKDKWKAVVGSARGKKMPERMLSDTPRPSGLR